MRDLGEQVGGGRDFAILNAGEVRLVRADERCQLGLTESHGLAGKAPLKSGTPDNVVEQWYLFRKIGHERSR